MDTAIAYREEFMCWVPNRPGEDPDDHEHDSSITCDWGWACNRCGVRVDDKPCPDHAPMEFPGLRLVECRTDPPHYLFAHDRDDYGHDCPQCHSIDLYKQLRIRAIAAERREHRHCWLFNRLKRLALKTGLVKWRGLIGSQACAHVDISWRWSR